MRFQEYAPLARRTLKLLPFSQHMTHMSLGAAGELGELLDAVKKTAVYGKPLDIVNVMEEAGDASWYVANLLPELVVPADFAQAALERGYLKGCGWHAAASQDVFQLANGLLALNKAVADVTASLPSVTEEAVGTSFAYSLIEQLTGNLGVIYGIFGLDPSDVMTRNIEKLAKRYGDKYSDYAALNRDLSGERKVLEDGAAFQTYRYSFDEVLQIGRKHYTDNGLAFSGPNRMPWSFEVNGLPVTHENDDKYIVNGMAFSRGETLVVSLDENGAACWTEPAPKVQ